MWPHPWRRLVAPQLAVLRGDVVLMTILGCALLLDGLGLGWGLPNRESWMADDISPWLPLRVPKTYFSGWHKYPFLHSWISLALYGPYLIYLIASDGLDLSCYPRIAEGCFSSPDAQLAILMLLSRALSVGMGLGMVFLVYRLAMKLLDDRIAARFAALLTAGSFVVVRYSHVGNLDLPSCLWFVASLCFLVEALRRGTLAAHVGFGLMAGAAVGTKEGIVGAYVLSYLTILVARARARYRAQPGSPFRTAMKTAVDRPLLGAACSLLGVYALATNPLHLRGFVEHWKLWLPSQPRMAGFHAGFTGYPDLLLEIGRNLGAAMGWPALLLCVAGVAHALGRRSSRLVLLVPATSYLLFSLLPAGYAPLRFALPWVPILAVFGGGLAARLLQAEGVARHAAAGLLALVIGHQMLHALNGDLMLVHDGRYLAEVWIRENVETDARFGVLGKTKYLPRLARLGHSVERPPDEGSGQPGLQGWSPDYLVLSSLYYPRLRGEPRAWLERRIAGHAGYRVVWRGRGHSPLEPWLGHRAARTDVNPEILILARQPQPRVGAAQ